MYDEQSALQKTLALDFLDFCDVGFSLSTCGILVDVGCGNGWISFASQKFLPHRLAFRSDKAEELKILEANTIDGIFSFSCIH